MAVSEDVGTSTISIASRASTVREAFIYVAVNSTGGRSDAIPGHDYDFLNISLEAVVFNFTIDPGATRNFEIIVIDDRIAEDMHYETMTYYVGIYEFGISEFCDVSIFVIEDDDGLRFEMLVPGITIYEDVGTVQLCVIYNEADNVPLSITATIIQWNSGDDIIFNANGTFFVVSTNSRICFDVIIINDLIIEFMEYYSFNLIAFNGSVIDLIHIGIIDNDAFTFGFEMSSYSVLESDGFVSVCVTADNGDDTEVYQINITSIIATTQGLVDHELVDRSFIISTILSRQCLNITINDDNITEEEEIFVLSITPYFISGNNSAYQLPTKTTTITIIDDDLFCSPMCVNGVCVFPGTCQCDDGWTNEDCSQEICQPPCGMNGMCNVNTGYCECFPGYTGFSCDDDILECKDDNGGCEQICTDFIGGYNCSCEEGFVPSIDNNKLCTDINECMEDHGCNQTCVNTPGSYYCNCVRGFQLVDFTECEDIDECSVLSPNGFCHQICVNTHGSYHCDCMEGYQLFGIFCQDINECIEMSDTCNMTGPVPADCINLQGSYRCTCDKHSGYHLSADGTTCEGLLLPTNVMAIQDGPTSILVTWTPSSDAIGYMIDYDSIGGDSGSVMISNGSTDEYTLTDLQNGDIYTVSIVTTSSDGETSESVRAMDVRLVSGPPTVSVLGFTTATSIFISLSVPTGSVVDSYEVMWQRDTTVGCPDVDEGSDSIITTLYDIKGLEENSRYIITVTASNSAGSSELSNTVTAITEEAVPSAAPTSVSVSEVTSSNITVQWEAVDCIHQNGDITSYSVQYNEVGSEIIRSLTVSQDEVTITGLSSSTTYSIEVAAINSAGTGVFSEVITTQTKLKLSLTCTASGISEVTIDCEGIEDATLQCSFNSGPLYQCSVPMVLTIDVHPPGIYFIRFVSSTGDEDTVTYNITDIKTDVSPIVPKLRVNLINGSPRLIAGNTAVEAEFEVSRPVAGVRCYLRSQTARVYKNCSSGVVSFDGLKSGRYILKVHAYNRGGDVATVKRGFVINDN